MAKKPDDKQTDTKATEAAGPEFGLQRIYLKDTSFETPNSPLIFQEKWEPEVNIDLQTKSDKVLDDVYEVVLTVTITAKVKEKTAFVAEVQQAGIFTIKAFPKDQLNQLLGSVCPGIIFPYARETVSDLVTRGSFPQLLMAPVNFDALYQQQMAAKTDAANEKGKGAAGDGEGRATQ